ncbi:hypothetical protein CDD80_6389 [Ophiocordyceps camponoti-rufipedis]|uniref:Uncharacterized protein n=1 Tax=Ophiocordyceps camponoti-rufipedis TaxID=2004952 RepID=A0A2C5YRE5_9HYPO|nr:hypothetical protein CDD80_6389 [Ophiocordyceps camponoti-rufipedis]
MILAAFIFRLAECVYKVLAYTPSLDGSSETVRWSSVLTAYLKCLDWYDGFFALPMADAPSSPFVLFVHRVLIDLLTAKVKAEDVEPTTVIVSAVDNARLLLTKMSETHPVAAMAANHLRPRPCS